MIWIILSIIVRYYWLYIYCLMLWRLIVILSVCDWDLKLVSVRLVNDSVRSSFFGFSFFFDWGIFLWYIFIDDIFNIIDYYITIPISTDNILMLHNIFIGITLFTVLILYVKDNKVIIRKSNKWYRLWQ